MEAVGFDGRSLKNARFGSDGVRVAGDLYVSMRLCHNEWRRKCNTGFFINALVVVHAL